MVNKTYVILIMIILVLVGIALFVELPEKDEEKENPISQISGRVVEDIPANDSDNLNGNQIGSNSESFVEGGGEGSSGSRGTESNPNNYPEINLPDIENSPCGFYFGGYEVCGGYCVKGSCIKDGEASCYCKID